MHQSLEDLFIAKTQWRAKIHQSLRLAMIIAFHSTCQHCNQQFESIDLHVDHISPSSGGGPNEVGNYTISCRECNLRKSNRSLPQGVKLFLQESTVRRNAEIQELQTHSARSLRRLVQKNDSDIRIKRLHQFSIREIFKQMDIPLKESY